MFSNKKRIITTIIGTNIITFITTVLIYKKFLKKSNVTITSNSNSNSKNNTSVISPPEGKIFQIKNDHIVENDGNKDGSLLIKIPFAGCFGHIRNFFSNKENKLFMDEIDGIITFCSNKSHLTYLHYLFHKEEAKKYNVKNITVSVKDMQVENIYAKNCTLVDSKKYFTQS